MKALVLLLLTLFVTASAFAQNKVDMKKDFDSLGDNDAIAERAKALDPDNKVEIVQNRLVDRNLRLEVGMLFGLVAGGDTYYSSQNLGADLDFHITPKLSLIHIFFDSAFCAGD